MIYAGKGRFRVSRDGGLTWPETVESRFVDRKTAEIHNLIRLKDDTIGGVSIEDDTSYEGVLLQSSSPPRLQHPTYLLFSRSDDFGKTWQKPERISPPSPFGVSYVGNNNLIRTSSGRLVLPVYGYMRLGDHPIYQQMWGSMGLRGNQWISTTAHQFDPAFSWSYVYFSDDEGPQLENQPEWTYLHLGFPNHGLPHHQ